MRKFVIIFMATLLLATFAFGEVNVTFKANTSMIRGVTDTTGSIDLRGPLQVGDPIHYQDGDWTGQDIILDNVGGDYWETTITFPDSTIDSTLAFKFGANIVDPLTGETSSYWENNAPGGEGMGNRTFVIPDTDTTLEMAYVGHPYGTTPFDDPNKIEVRFRVNMAQQANLNNFDPAVDTAHVAGNFNGWGHDPLSREGTSLYYDTTIVVSEKLDSTVAPEWKFTYGAWDGTEEGNNRLVEGVTGDTTLQWRWYNDQPIKPVEGDTISLTFQADLQQTVNNNGFSTTEDSIALRVGYENSASPFIDTSMARKSQVSYVYERTIDEIVVPMGEKLFYQYYKIGGNGNETREIYYNFDYPDKGAPVAERRAVVINSEGQVIKDVEESQLSQRRMPRLQNTNPVSQNVEVAYEVNMKPAFVQVAKADSNNVLEDIQANQTIDDTSQIDSVFINGPATGAWTGWGPTLASTANKKMYDDGTHGDKVANDTIYTQTFTYGPDSANNNITQQLKFGINGGDNEGGYGNNHYVNINDAESTDRIRLQWGSINPKFYYLWDYDKATSVQDNLATNPEEFKLGDNYPNPFNPTTTIEYTLPHNSNVKLTIYNILGEKIKSMSYSNKPAGTYRIQWNGMNDNGVKVSSGVYFYKLDAKNFHSIKKMILLK